MSLAYIIDLATKRSEAELSLWLQSNFALAPDGSFAGSGIKFIADAGLTTIRVDRHEDSEGKNVEKEFGFLPTKYFYIVGFSSQENAGHEMALKVTAAMARDTAEDFITCCDTGTMLAVRRNGKLTLSSDMTASIHDDLLLLFKGMKYERKPLAVF